MHSVIEAFWLFFIERLLASSFTLRDQAVEIHLSIKWPSTCSESSICHTPMIHGTSRINRRAALRKYSVPNTVCPSFHRTWSSTLHHLYFLSCLWNKKTISSSECYVTHWRKLRRLHRSQMVTIPALSASTQSPRGLLRLPAGITASTFYAS